MRASWYAKALYSISTAGNLPENTAIEHFIGTIQKNGHSHMLKRILRSYERIVLKHIQGETIEVTTSIELPQSEVATLLRNEPFSQILSPAHKRVIRKVDPSIIGGAIARTGLSRIDASYKHKLLGLYQSLTNPKT